MKIKLLTTIALLAMTSLVQLGANPVAIQNTDEPMGKPVRFTFGGENNQEFHLDGKPFQIRGGEIHPQRIPRSHWQQRIRAVKAMGLNTIAFYIFWNGIEQPDGTFKFEGMNDIDAFIKLCREEKMWVLFRPGPYVCGEWDLGGLPHYLLKEQGAKLRTTQNPEFMKAQERYLNAIAAVAEPHLCKNGGPILMTQLENEYGSYNTPHTEKAYMEWLKDFWTKKGFAPLYTSDGATARHLRFALPDVAIGLDPGTNDQHWANANKAMPDVPVFSSETYPGWLRHWGEGNWKPTVQTIETVKWYMETGKSFSIFMVHGGTSFGLVAGANNAGEFKRNDGINIVHSEFAPDLTSYDYGSPIDEQGAPTPEYTQYRAAIQAKLPEGATLPDVPEAPPAVEIPEFTPKRVGGIMDWTLLKEFKPVKSKQAPWFESFDQNQGMAVYETTIPAGDEAELTIQYMHDFGMVYVDGKYIGSMDRTKRPNKTFKKDLVTLPKRDKKARLEILVDTFGHINFHESMDFDRKGIYGTITLGDKELTDWTVKRLPLDTEKTVSSLGAKGSSKATDYRGSRFAGVFTVQSPVRDTFLDMSRYSKGYVWVNGHCLGRYWNVGPQQRLFCPRDFLKEGSNTVYILDLNLTEPAPLKGMLERNKEEGSVDTRNLNNDW